MKRPLARLARNLLVLLVLLAAPALASAQSYAYVVTYTKGTWASTGPGRSSSGSFGLTAWDGGVVTGGAPNAGGGHGTWPDDGSGGRRRRRGRAPPDVERRRHELPGGRGAPARSAGA